MTLPLGGVRDQAQEPSVDHLNDKAAQSLILYATPVSVSRKRRSALISSKSLVLVTLDPRKYLMLG